MKIYLAISISLLLGYSMSSCSSNPTTEVKYDTTIVRDTLPIAMARFVSMMPDGQSLSLKLTSSVDDIAIASAPPFMTLSYLPLPPDLHEHYDIFDTVWLDSISISPAQLSKGSINTFALFPVEDSSGNITGITFSPGNDSMHLKKIPDGYSMLRVINGNPSTPSQAIVTLDLDNMANPIDTVQSGTIGKYVAVTATTHSIIIGTASNQSLLSSVQQPFESGVFYTARYVGDSKHTAIFAIDKE